ncbi:MAG: hypothetical protein ACPGOY_09545 [Rhodospirillaceae bacterium]
MSINQIRIGVALLCVAGSVGLMLQNWFPYSLLFPALQGFGFLSVGLITVVVLVVAMVPLVPIALLLKRWEAQSHQQEASRAVFCLPHHDVHAKALRYDSKTGTATVLARKAVRGPLRRGFYVDIAGGVAGVYATTTGPVFFIDARRIPIDATTTATVMPGRLRHVFRMVQGQETVVDLSYAPPVDAGLGEMGLGEAERDFFIWLAGAISGTTFRDYYTLEPYPTK